MHRVFGRYADKSLITAFLCRSDALSPLSASWVYGPEYKLSTRSDGRCYKNIDLGGGFYMKKETAVIDAFTSEAILKRKIRAQSSKARLSQVAGWRANSSVAHQEGVRALHFEQRKAGLKAQREFVLRVFPKLQQYLARAAKSIREG